MAYFDDNGETFTTSYSEALGSLVKDSLLFSKIGKYYGNINDITPNLIKGYYSKKLANISNASENSKFNKNYFDDLTIKQTHYLFHKFNKTKAIDYFFLKNKYFDLSVLKEYNQDFNNAINKNFTKKVKVNYNENTVVAFDEIKAVTFYCLNGSKISELNKFQNNSFIDISKFDDTPFLQSTVTVDAFDKGGYLRNAVNIDTDYLFEVDLIKVNGLLNINTAEKIGLIKLEFAMDFKDNYMFLPVTATPNTNNTKQILRIVKARNPLYHLIALSYKSLDEQKHSDIIINSRQYLLNIQPTLISQRDELIEYIEGKIVQIEKKTSDNFGKSFYKALFKQFVSLFVNIPAIDFMKNFKDIIFFLLHETIKVDNKVVDRDSLHKELEKIIYNAFHFEKTIGEEEGSNSTTLLYKKELIRYNVLSEYLSDENKKPFHKFLRIRPPVIKRIFEKITKALITHYSELDIVKSPYLFTVPTEIYYKKNIVLLISISEEKAYNKFIDINPTTLIPEIKNSYNTQGFNDTNPNYYYKSVAKHFLSDNTISLYQKSICLFEFQLKWKGYGLNKNFKIPDDYQDFIFNIKVPLLSSSTKITFSRKEIYSDWFGLNNKLSGIKIITETY